VQVVNDDGPPSNRSSPYVHSLVATLQEWGHAVSVVLPHVQRSWIGKAHLAGELITPTYFRPGTLHQDDGTVHERPLAAGGAGEEWVLVNGTPATCAQLGLFHFFQDRGPVDVVVSGPNHGRNATALFSLSSGTIGGAMEAALFRKKAIALSYAYYGPGHDPALIAEASSHSVRIIEYFYQNWGEDVGLYTINIPLVKGVQSNKIMYTNALQNFWRSGSSYDEVAIDQVPPPDRAEEEIREEKGGAGNMVPSRHQHRHFKWAPKFADIHKSIEESAPGNDGWALTQGYTR
jgi:5'/3'-nucleotidase SurE